MFVVFVTGPLASGKHCACQYLAQQGYVHVDLDDMSKEFLDDDDVKEQLAEYYGTYILDESGAINRAHLAERAFINEDSTALLNSVMWPRVKARLSDLIVGKSCQFNQSEDRLVVEIPMLAEAPDLIELADTTLCVTADAGIRLERALARGMQYEDIIQRMGLQASDEERNALCDAVIENNGTLEQLYEKLDSWLISQQQEHMF